MDTMKVKLLLLINCVIIVNCQPTTTHECELSVGTKYEMLMNIQLEMKSEIEEIRQIMLKHHGNETQAMQEIKSQSEEIREIVLRQHGNETQAMQEMKSEFEEIRQIVFNETQTMQVMKSQSEEIRQLVLKQHGNETQNLRELKSGIEEIRQILFKQHGNETQAMQVMKSKTEEIRQLMLKQHGNETQNLREMKFQSEAIRQIVLRQHGSEAQSLQEMKSKTEEIRQIVIQQQNWSRIQQRKTECPVGFNYLPEVDRCLTFVFEGMTWDSAFERCRQLMPGVHLAAITSQRKNDAVVRYLQSQFSKNGIGSPLLPYGGPWSHGVWIGGQRINRRNCANLFIWKTLNGIEIPFSFTNWKEGEPQCHDNEDCVHIAPRLGYVWNDARCSLLYFPLCEA